MSCAFCKVNSVSSYGGFPVARKSVKCIEKAKKNSALWQTIAVMLALLAYTLGAFSTPNSPISGEGCAFTVLKIWQPC